MNLKQYFEGKIKEYSEFVMPIDLTNVSVGTGGANQANAKLKIFKKKAGQPASNPGDNDQLTVINLGKQDFTVAPEDPSVIVLTQQGQTTLQTQLQQFLAGVDANGNPNAARTTIPQDTIINIPAGLRIKNSAIELEYNSDNKTLTINAIAAQEIQNPPQPKQVNKYANAK